MENFGLDSVLKEVQKINSQLADLKDKLEKQKEVDFCTCIRQVQNLLVIEKQIEKIVI